MSSFILPRRRFLIGPAIVAATSLMPGHSIIHLLAPKLRKFDFIIRNTNSEHLPISSTGLIGLPEPPAYPKLVPLTPEEAKILETNPDLLASNGRFDMISNSAWLVNIDPETAFNS